jgi:hypothetical protein
VKFSRDESKGPFDLLPILGLVVTLLLHGGAVVGIILHRRALAAASETPPPPEYVVARLVQGNQLEPVAEKSEGPLGKDPVKPKKLPNKIVPQKPTRKAKGLNLTADANDKPNRRSKKRDEREMADRMRDALRKAELFSKAQKEIQAEGSRRQGVRHGTAKAGKGDMYMTRIADKWNRTWSLPSIIPRDEAKKLYVLIVVRVDKRGKIQFPIKFDRRSGNKHFDSSVETAWQRIKAIPVPPPDRMASILAHGLALKLNWRGMQ